MNFEYFGHITTFWIFMRIKTACTDIKHRKQFNDKLAVGCFISTVSLCENQQKQHFPILTGNLIMEHYEVSVFKSMFFSKEY